MLRDTGTINRAMGVVQDSAIVAGITALSGAYCINYSHFRLNRTGAIKCQRFAVRLNANFIFNKVLTFLKIRMAPARLIAQRARVFRFPWVPPNRGR